jgi:hypothetical protein
MVADAVTDTKVGPRLSEATASTQPGNGTHYELSMREQAWRQLLVENSHPPIWRCERAALRFWQIKSL